MHPRWISFVGPWLGLSVLSALLTSLPVLGAESWQISLVGDMYPEGRNVPRPTAAHPAYYYPVVIGYVELGAQQTGDTPPSKKEMVHGLAGALAGQGYLVTNEVAVPPKARAKENADEPATLTALSPPPSLLLVFNWGSLRPQKFGGALGGDVTTSIAPPAILNKGQMLGLIAGRKFDSIVDFGMKTDEILQGIQDDRYFIMVSAYAFDAYFQHHKKVLLWVAKISVPAAGVTPSDVMPSLIKASGPLFGNETIGPKLLEVPKAPEGKVEVGTPTVVEPARN